MPEKDNKSNFDRYNGSIYTDLALESAEALCGENSIDDLNVEGVKIEKEEKNGSIITWVEILNEKGSEKMGKPIGNYVTIESGAMKENDVDMHESIIEILSKCLIRLKKLDGNSSVLVAGLGNSSVTPDALGPKVVSKILVTRHIMDTIPNSTAMQARPVAAVSPGVMGTTGIETCDIIKGICDKIEPSLVIAVDALAARRTSRVNATIQLSDTGVSPGSGMGNLRKVINEKFLNVPVIAIGVPTAHIYRVF